jgi:cytochrome c oxidase assembly factor CtaG
MRWRAASMAAGLAAVLAAAAVPPSAAAPGHVLTLHMVELVALMYVAGPLIAAAAPLRPRYWRLRSMSVAFAAFVLAQWAVHLPALVRIELHGGWVHGAGQAVLLGAAVVFWSPVVSWPAERSPLTPIVYLVAAMPAGDALSIWLMTTPLPAYGGITTSDQRAAAATMLCGSIVLALAAVMVGWRAIHREHATLLAREHGEPRHA